MFTHREDELMVKRSDATKRDSVTRHFDSYMRIYNMKTDKYIELPRQERGWWGLYSYLGQIIPPISEAN